MKSFFFSTMATLALTAWLSLAATQARATLTLETEGGQNFTTDASWVVLTGIASEAVKVNDTTGGVTYDPGMQTWSYLGPLSQGMNFLQIQTASGGETTSVTVVKTGVPENLSYPSFGPDKHLAGAWMFTWFGDPSWKNSSPWWPVGGFATCTGDVEWANAINVLRAAKELLEEGYQPPRLALFQDCAIINFFYTQSHSGAALDVSTAAGRDLFFDYTKAFHEDVYSILGDRYRDAAMARYNDRPIIAYWFVGNGSVIGASEAFVQDQKARFEALWGKEPYYICHPHSWSSYASVDEITLMFGPSNHFHTQSSPGKNTMNITPGFWNPISNPHYIPREGGADYNTAWENVLARRDSIDHVFIDSWNETGEGSGIFEAQTFTYTTADDGELNNWNYTHNEYWGDTPRHYIDATANYAAQWNDDPADDALFIAADVPATLGPGQQRRVTVVMRNTGDRAWNPTDGDRLDVIEGVGLVPGGAVLLDETVDQIDKYGGVFRGKPRAFTFELSTPTEQGTHTLTMQMRKGDAGALYGDAVSFEIQIVDPNNSVDDFTIYR